MSYNKGKYKLFYIKIGSEYLPIGCLTSNNFSEYTETITTAKDSNQRSWKASIPTNQGYTMSISGLVTISDKEGSIVTYNYLKGLKRDKILIDWKTDSEKEGFTNFGKCYITSLSNDASVGEYITFSAELEGYHKPLYDSYAYNYLNYTLNFNL